MSKIDANFIKGYLNYIVNIYKNTKNADNPKPLSPDTQFLHQTGFTSMLNYATKLISLQLILSINFINEI